MEQAPCGDFTCGETCQRLRGNGLRPGTFETRRAVWPAALRKANWCHWNAAKQLAMQQSELELRFLHGNGSAASAVLPCA